MIEVLFVQTLITSKIHANLIKIVTKSRYLLVYKVKYVSKDARSFYLPYKILLRPGTWWSILEPLTFFVIAGRVILRYRSSQFFDVCDGASCPFLAFFTSIFLTRDGEAIFRVDIPPIKSG